MIQSITADNAGLQQTTPDSTDNAGLQQTTSHCNRQRRIATDNIDAFTELAKTLIEERGAEETLAGALACMTGPPTPPPPLSHAPSPSLPLPSPPLPPPPPPPPAPRSCVCRLAPLSLRPIHAWAAPALDCVERAPTRRRVHVLRQVVVAHLVGTLVGTVGYMLVLQWYAPTRAHGGWSGCFV